LITEIFQNILYFFGFITFKVIEERLNYSLSMFLSLSLWKKSAFIITNSYNKISVISVSDLPYKL